MVLHLTSRSEERRVVLRSKVVLETTSTGKYNPAENGSEILFRSDGEAQPFFTQFLGLDMNEEQGGENAQFTYNNHLGLTSRDNSYSLNGITFDFQIGRASCGLTF